MDTTTCLDCHRVLSSESSLANHRQKYCRYRPEKKAKKTSAVARQPRNVVLDDEEFRGLPLERRKLPELEKVSMALHAIMSYYRMML